MIVNRITSQVKDTGEDIEINNWKEAGLMIESTIRLHKIATINKRLIERKLGSLSKPDAEKYQKKLKDFGKYSDEYLRKIRTGNRA